MFEKIKAFVKDFFNAQKSSLLWGILIIIIGIIVAIFVCGIYGNNEENFYYKGDDVCEVANGKPRPPFYPKETPPVKKGVNIINGKIVIKA